MSKFVLLSIVIVPLLIAVQAAKVRIRARGLLTLLILLLAFDVLFMAMLYVLRDQWLEGAAVLS